MLLLICLINFSISSSGGRGVVIIMFLQQNIGLTWDQSVNLSFPSRSSRKTRVLYLSRFDHDSLKKFKNAIFQISKLKTFNDFQRILTKIDIHIGKIKSPENRYQYICFRMWCPPPSSRAQSLSSSESWCDYVTCVQSLVITKLPPKAK